MSFVHDTLLDTRMRNVETLGHNQVPRLWVVFCVSVFQINRGITDTFIIENLTILEESKSNGTMKIAGLFQRADTPNHNKRIYRKKK